MRNKICKQLRKSAQKLHTEGPEDERTYKVYTYQHPVTHYRVIYKKLKREHHASN